MSLPELLDLLKAKGVSHYSGTLSGSQVTVTFAAVAAPEPQRLTEAQLAEPLPELELCACGHSVEGEHSEMGCLRGCTAEQCTREKKGRRKS